MLTKASRRALEILDAHGFKCRYDSRDGSYSFGYYGTGIRLETQHGEWGVCLSAEFPFWQCTSLDLMKNLQHLVDKGSEGFIVKEIAPGLGRVAKEWLIDCEKDLSEDHLISMLDELLQAWHSISFNLHMTREREPGEYIEFE